MAVMNSKGGGTVMYKKIMVSRLLIMSSYVTFHRMRIMCHGRADV